MSGVIVVDAESFRSTCLGRDAYIHDHCLDILITMLNSVNCSIVICSPTVESCARLRIGSCPSHNSPNDVIPLLTTSNVHGQETVTIY